MSGPMRSGPHGGAFNHSIVGLMRALRVETSEPRPRNSDSDDWFDVLTAVFDPLDAQSEVHPWGSTENEYRAMTRGQQPVYDRGVFDEVRRLEHEIFALEEQHGTLWDHLADYVRRTPEEFIRQDSSDP